MSIFKTGHFVAVKIRPTGPSAALPRKEVWDGESAQDGIHRRDSYALRSRLVAAGNCPAAGCAPRDGLAARPVSGRHFKTGHFARRDGARWRRLGGGGHRLFKTGQYARRESVAAGIWLGEPSARHSYCDQFRETIEAKRAAGLTAQRIYQDLVAEQSFARSYSTVQRYVRRLEHVQPLPFRRLECAPGEEAQVDFGVGAPIVTDGGKRRKTHVFRIVLSHSRKAYSEAVDRQTTDNFIRCLENAFAHFGGVPQTLVIDNLKAAVTQADWFDPELNPKLRAFAAHYGVAILPTRPRTPRHKGKVERGVGYVQSNALKGRSFASLAAQNEHLLDWETNVADCRIHGTTRKQVGHVFREIEQPALRPLPAERFPLFHEAQRTVNRDGHVSVEQAYYSVPVEYLTRSVWVRWDARLVRIFNHRLEQIAIHAKQPPGKFSTHTGAYRHGEDQRRSSAARPGYYRRRAISARTPNSGPRPCSSVAASKACACCRGCRRWPTKHGALAIDAACEVAESYRAYRLRTIRELVKRHAPQQQSTSSANIRSFATWPTTAPWLIAR